MSVLLGTDVPQLQDMHYLTTSGGEYAQLFIQSLKNNTLEMLWLP